MLIMEDQSAPDLRRFYLGHAQVRRAVGSPRRCLFGAADPAETRRFVQEEMREIYERQKKKWNFDFELERPADRPSERPARQPAITDLLRTRKRQRVPDAASKPAEDGPAAKRVPSPDRDAAASL